MPEFPKSIRMINDRLKNLDPVDVGRKSKIMANVIAAQMLSSSALRGGTSLKIRYDDHQTRGSKDLDIALSSNRDEFIVQYKDRLSLGWNGFTGVLKQSRKISNPENVPSEYITETWDLKLSFNGKEWLSQEIDIGHDEIGDTSDVELESSPEINSWFAVCGLPIPNPVPVIQVHHQIAQKIHALASNPLERIHDLVDLQVIFKNQDIDPTITAITCVRLFKSRRALPWPPELKFNLEAKSLYTNAVEQTGAVPDLELAVAWFNEMIAKLSSQISK